MSMARHHNEWLGLVPTSGPFLSLETLLRVFPQGLPARDAEIARQLRLAWEEWENEGESSRPNPAIHTAWIRFVLITLLGLPAEALAEGQRIPEGLKAEKPEYGVTLRPNLVLTALPPRSNELSLDLDEPDPADTVAVPPFQPLMFLQVYGRGQGLEKPARSNDVWAASPATRMQELLSQTRVPLGLITNGEDWMLVHRATDTTGFASFSVPIWLEEPLTLRAFCALLGPERFFGHPDETLLKMLADSAQDHQEVTDQLGYQVRHAVEMLVQAIDEIDRNRNGELLTGVPPATLYEGALTLMMRLVFLLCAEERGMFPLDEEIYERNYAVSTLMATLRESADFGGEEILERRCNAWSRLLATFRAIWDGVEHEAMRLPAYGGGLLDPNRFPWLDSSASGAIPLPIHNRTVLHLLEALQILRVKLPGGGPPETRRLSFRALNIEQIGHVYEGLLDHTAVRATEPTLGLIGTKDREPEIALATLEALVIKGRKELLAFLKEETGRTEKALQNAMEAPMGDAGRLLAACDGKTDLLARIRPFAALIRQDEFDRYVVIPAGRAYVTEGTARRSTGTHYTPRSLTEPIVRRTLEPIIYRGMAQGVDPSLETLKTAEEILAIKVCDMACGSGAFLVESCRYLADRLCEAWEIAEKAVPDALLTIPVGKEATGDPGERLVPSKEESPEERRILARRLVAAHCLYGVDKNPQAVDIAKLSLWLVTMERDKPFHFLDHAIKCGDSLLGCIAVEQLRSWSLSGKSDSKQMALDLFSNKVFDEAVALRRHLENLPSDSIEFIERKSRLFGEFDKKMQRARLAADLIIAPALMNAKPPVQAKKRADFQHRFVAFPFDDYDPILQAEAESLLGSVRPFHWPLEFPEVFEEGGFDVILGNPPFMGGSKITGELGVPYREHLVNQLGRGKKGRADIVAYFFLRAIAILKDNGTFGLIATNTIAQGDTREVGLEQIIEDRYTIYHGFPSMKWPGKANLEVAVVHTFKGVWGGSRFICERVVTGISSILDDNTSSGKPFHLAENAGKSFHGAVIIGMGFVLEPEQARTLISQDSKNADVICPYLNGEDLNSRSDQSPSRWIINFKDWPLGRIGQRLPDSGETLLNVAETMEINLSDEWRPKSGSRWAQSEAERREKWLRLGVVPFDYPGPVASDYPECLAIVEKLVRPERSILNRDQYRRVWWRYAERQPALQRAIADLPCVLATTRVSAFRFFAFYGCNIVFNDRLAVFPIPEYTAFSALSSTIHQIWAHRPGVTTHETRPTYNPEESFETFPFPRIDKGQSAELIRIGEAYNSHRKAVCMSRYLGLTKVYNLFHDPNCTDTDITELRRLHVEMDTAVAAAYDWQDIILHHDFYGDEKEKRYTLHPDAKSEILRRLLTLNHERHAEQEAESEEIVPTLEDELDERPIRRASKVKEAKAAYVEGQTSIDSLLIEAILEEQQKRKGVTASGNNDIERAALMATYLVMRAEAPERLSGLRRHPAKIRLTMPREYRRTRLAKHLYFTQEVVKPKRRERQPVTSLAFTEYQRGPYTKQIEIVEQEAVRRDWLKVEAVWDEGRSSVFYTLGPKAEEAVKEALALMDDEESHLDQELVPLDEEKTVRSEQWTTIHFAWKRLREELGHEPTFAEVEAYVHDWKPDRAAFSYNAIYVTYQELKLRGLLSP